MTTITEETYTFKKGTFIYQNVFDVDFSNLTTLTQSLGFILNSKGEILFTSDNNKKWELLGGTIEEGETPIETLIREVYEETAVIIDESSIEPFFYTNLYELKNNVRVYMGSQLRYIALIKQIDKFVSDPGGNRAYKLFSAVEEFDKVFAWEGKRIKDNLIVRLEELDLYYHKE